MFAKIKAQHLLWKKCRLSNSNEYWSAKRKPCVVNEQGGFEIKKLITIWGIRKLNLKRVVAHLFLMI